MDAFLERLAAFDISYVHAPREYSWGQRVVRFYDPDGHMIEVGEDMGVVVRRFAAGGLAEEQIAERMGVPLDYVRTHLRP